ncbi:MAG TPA: hypothetical protein VNA17_11590 [Pyrinomonadaceae bacterium]|nr:hypothetical protein [Pyrinomonadaceae bacterium]
MARPLILSLDGVEYPITLIKIDRDKLYGRVEIEAFDEKGRPAELRVLAADGKTLIDKGGTALATVNDKGDSVERSVLVPVDADGEKIEQVPSSFGRANELTSATVEDYFRQIVKSVYLVQPFENSDIGPLYDQLSADQMFTFPFSWRGGVEYDNAFLIGAGKDAFMVVGKQTEFQFIKLNQATVLDATEEEEISADDLDFDLL